MALKPKEIRAMNPSDRAKALLESRQELMHQRGLAAMGGAVKNPGLIRDLRTSIARILTINHQDQLAGKSTKATVRPTPRQAAEKAAAAKPSAKAKAPKPAKSAAKAAPKAAKAAPKKESKPKTASKGAKSR